MRTKSISVILALAVWLLISPGLLFAQQDSLPGSPLSLKQGTFPVPPSSPPDTVITVTKLPYPDARLFPNERSELPYLQRLPSPVERGRGRGFEDCIKQRHQLQLTADLTTLQESKKGAWLKYLPSVSAGLAPAIRRGADGSFSSGLSPTLSIGVNSSLIYQSHRDKQQRKASREAIIKQNQLQEATKIAQLHRLQRRLQTEIDKLNLQNGVSDIDRQLFTLYQKQYDNHDISPEEYLLKRKAFLLQELRNQDQLDRIQNLQYQVEDLAGCLETPIDPNFSQKNFTPLSKR
jgi:hypothetical protein